MKLYGETRFFRFRQMATDAALAIWILIWVRVGVFMKRLVDKLAGPGESIEGAGSSFRGTMGDISEEIAEIPAFGEPLSSPFEAAADAGMRLQEAGQGQQDVVHRIAWWLGLLLALIPITVVLLRYVPARLKWIREASAAHGLRIDASDLQLFALRAIANRPLHELRRACADPARAFAQGDYVPLARFELASLGLSVGDGPESSDRSTIAD